MLIRVTGKLSDGKPFASRVDAGSAIEAVDQVSKMLVKAGRQLTDVVEISGKPMEASDDLHIGEVRKPRAKSETDGATSAQSTAAQSPKPATAKAGK